MPLTAQIASWAHETTAAINALTAHYSTTQLQNLKVNELLTILQLLPNHVQTQEELAYHQKAYAGFVEFYRIQEKRTAKAYSLERWEPYKQRLQEMHGLVGKHHHLWLWIPIGMAMGLPFGVAMGNIALGLPLGMSIGLAIGSGLNADARKKNLVH